MTSSNRQAPDRPRYWVEVREARRWTVKQRLWAIDKAMESAARYRPARVRVYDTLARAVISDTGMGED